MEINNNMTAIQELYLALRNSRPSQWNDILIIDEDKLLQKEKQQIIDAFDESSSRICLQCDNFKTGEDYFKTTYK